MYRYRYRYLTTIGLLGLFLVVASQIATLGKHYSSLWGDMWAIVCFTGLATISFAASLVLTRYVSHLKRTFFNSVLRIETFGIVLITNLAAVYSLRSAISRSDILTMDDGSGRRGVFLAWFASLILFTMLNILFSIARVCIIKIKKEKVSWF